MVLQRISERGNNGLHIQMSRVELPYLGELHQRPMSIPHKITSNDIQKGVFGKTYQFGL